MLSDEDRAHRQRARELLRRATAILKRAGIAQNEIARKADYTSGYLPQLLKEDAPGDRLTPIAITRLTTAIAVLGSDAVLRLDEDARIEFQQTIEALRANYGETKYELVGPGEALKPTAANYLYRNFDSLVTEQIVSHQDFKTLALCGPPGSGKTWAAQKGGFGASQSHHVCTIDLRAVTNSQRDGVDEITGLFLNALERRTRWLSQQLGLPPPESEVDQSLPAPEQVAYGLQTIANVVATASEQGNPGSVPGRLMIIIDDIDRLADSSPFVRVLRAVQNDAWDYANLDRVMIVVGATVQVLLRLDDEALNSKLYPSYDVRYLSSAEVRRLVELWQATGLLRNMPTDELIEQAELFGGHPLLISQYLQGCRVEGEVGQAEQTLLPGSNGWTIVARQLARFGSACRRERFDSARQSIERWLGPDAIEVTEKDHSQLPALLKRFGLTIGASWQPFLMPACKQDHPLHRAFLEVLAPAKTGSGTGSAP